MAKRKSLYDLVMSHDIIYSLMYAPYIVEWRSLEEQIIEIKTKELKWFEDHTGFIWVWGYPGPDANMYNLKDYGKSWAFTKDELMRYGGRKNDN